MNELFSGNAFNIHLHQDIALVNFDLLNEKINKFDEAVLNELGEVCEILSKNQSKIKAALFQSSKKASFIVGADINVIKKLDSESLAFRASELGQKIFSKWEDLPIPTIAAIDGPCMGGGTEFSLACDYMICSDSPKTIIALPEVKLGIFPGWGGTYRLPKRIGLLNSLDMILSGKNIRAQKAKKIGLVDECVPAALFKEEAFKYSQLIAEGKSPFKKRKISLQEKLLTQNPLGKALVFKKARQNLLKQSKGHYPAPEAALELMRKHGSLSRDAFMNEEAKAFSKCAISDICKNLIQLFFIMEENKKDIGTEEVTPEQLKQLSPIQQLGVLGAGVMGGGIAYQSASKGLRVQMKDINQEAVSTGLSFAQKLFSKQVSRRRLKKHQAQQKMDLIRGQTDYSGFKALDLVIEAIVENLDIKNKVFQELTEQVHDDCIIATNTSSLRLKDMVAHVKNPERFVGLHFFNPVHKMPLVEIISQEQTKPEAIAKSVQYVKNIGKTPLVVKDGPGFLVNRLLIPWMLEVGYCLEDGCNIEKLDKEITKFGMPMGGFELMDVIGLDVVQKISPIFHQSLGERFKANDLVGKIIQDTNSPKKRFGQKTGLGFYHWFEGKKTNADQEAIERLTGLDLSGKNFLLTGDTLIHRLIFPMINEAAIVLDEKIVKSPSQIDLGLIFGIGFPPFRGGLCRYADSIGLTKVVSELDRMSSLYGERFKASTALKKLASEQGSFYVE